MGCTMPIPNLAIQADTAKDDVPQATGIVTYSQFLGGTIALSIAGCVPLLRIQHAQPRPHRRLQRHLPEQARQRPARVRARRARGGTHVALRRHTRKLMTRRPAFAAAAQISQRAAVAASRPARRRVARVRAGAAVVSRAARSGVQRLGVGLCAHRPQRERAETGGQPPARAGRPRSGSAGCWHGSGRHRIGHDPPLNDARLEEPFYFPSEIECVVQVRSTPRGLGHTGYH